MSGPLDLYRDDELITVHGLAALAGKRAKDVRFILSCEGVTVDLRLDVVRVGDLRAAGLLAKGDVR